MTTKLLLPDEYHLAHQTYGFVDHFRDYVDGTNWTAGGDAGGSAAVSDTAGGLMTITSDGDDNDEYWLEHDNEIFLFADNKPLIFMCIAGFTEANTDDASIFMGLIDANGANTLVDDGAGPKTSASGMGFEKRDGETEWRAWSSKSTTQTTTKLEIENKNNLSGVDQTAGTASPTYKKFYIEFTPITSTDADVDFWIDETHVAKHKNFDYSSATQMQVAFNVKAGGANAEALKVKVVAAYQKY